MACFTRFSAYKCLQSLPCVFVIFIFLFDGKKLALNLALI
jgi:hypothetical protein